MDRIALYSLVEKALIEDISWGDITSNALIPQDSITIAKLTAKSDSVVCGLDAFELAFKIHDPSIHVTIKINEGSKTNHGDIVAVVEGNTRSILTSERTALNFFNHMSGIATLTRKVSERIENTGCKVVDTRKTLPLLRMIEKYSVRIGGGQNHRHDLSSLYLIKDNHIQAVGSIEKAVKSAKKAAIYTKIECEVTNLAGAIEASDAGADIILFDNMKPEQIKEAIKELPKNLLFEASGNIKLENCLEYAQSGVHAISMGSLTHSAPYADFSLEF
jgi:nicotinate-nucleotide pyrophosphorylase (carboxylating)